METKSSGTQPAMKNKGWLVTFAGTGSLLAMGVLYSWSVISKQIPTEWGWTELEKSLPYSVAVLVFALMMAVGGRLQDRFGPRIVVTIGGILGGLGVVISSQTTSPLGYIIGFGVLFGTGIGFAYAAATPAAVKWFPAKRTGLIAGIVLAGFGTASAYVAPMSNALIAAYGIQNSLLYMGIGMTSVVMILSQFIQTPPAGYVPAGSPVAAPGAAVQRIAYTPDQVVKTWQFYSLWLMFAFSAGAGLMVISKLATIVELQAGLKLGFVLVSVLALGNGGGRVIGGMLSDKYGRKPILLGSFIFQAVVIYLLSRASVNNVLGTTPALILISALVGANYGSNLSVFPSISKDYYGLKHFGSNYGLVYTAWGLGGFMLSLFAGSVFDATRSFSFAYTLSVILLIVSAAMAAFLKAPALKAEPVIKVEMPASSPAMTHAEALVPVKTDE